MKLTNRNNLPPQIVSAILRDDYSARGADYTATSIIQPPRILQLRKRYAKQIVSDASDMTWSMLGRLMHKMLEHADDTGSIHEERLMAVCAGKTISCQTDVYSTHHVDHTTHPPRITPIPETISDYKFIKVQAAGFPHPEWEQQLNINAWVWIENGFPVKRLEILAFFRDWSLMESMRKHRYPAPVERYEQRLWDKGESDIWLESMVRLHESCKELPDSMLPFCTPENQWRREAKWQVRHPHKKKAVKNFADPHDADEYARSLGNQHYVDHVPATPIRCLHFCEVRPFCNQFTLENPDYQEDLCSKD